jgi:homoserine kinase type II
MAVWTQVSNSALDSFLSNYRLGRVLSFKAIAEGVENSNYFLQTEKGNFILTLYEKRVDEKDLPFFLDLMSYLAQSSVSVAQPLAQKSGSFYGQLLGKPAAVIEFLPGRWQTNPSPSHCSAFGKALAQLHLNAKDFKQTRENKMGAAHWSALLASCEGIEEKLRGALEKEIAGLEKLWQGFSHLPRGIIHGDCFPDNVLFDKSKVSIIDFYFACEDVLAFDLAIGLNAWSWSGSAWDKANATALTEGYESVRPLSAEEKAALPVLCRCGALRFLLTRIADRLAFEAKASAPVMPKDPQEYKALLDFHQQGNSIL